jgi:hypothetical protein
MLQKEPNRQEGIMKKLSTLGMIIGATLLCAAPVSMHLSPTKGVRLSLDTAEARIGRPLTPFSVAGVNRRMNRRAYYGGYGGYYGYHRPYYAYGGYYHRPYYAYGYHRPYYAYGYHPY